LGAAHDLSTPYESLEAVNTAYLFDKAKKYVDDIHFDAYNYVEKEKGGLRSLESRIKIDNEILQCCEDNSKSLIAELKSINIFDVEDIEEIAKILKEKLEDYSEKTNKEIDDIISDYS
jgi:hypothetical protein